MTQEQVYKVWAPEDCVWSPWVSPVLFSQIHCTGVEEASREAAPEWVAWLDGTTAVVLDLPGDESVRVGLSLVPQGFWPVPVYNCSPGPEESTMFRLVMETELKSLSPVNMRAIVNAICAGTPWLSGQNPRGVRPVFLLDWLRLPGREPEPGMFDNRWITIPQDYPSADFLKREGIRKVLLVRRHGLEPMTDLAHVLLRWQEKGIEIFGKDLERDLMPSAIRVTQPKGFKTSWYRVLARLGLRRSSAGGFGSKVPEMSGAG